MVGNNECRARSVSDRERGALLARKRALERWLGFSRLWLLLSRTPEALSRTWDKNPSPGRVANTPAEYRENVRELIRTARRMRSKIVVMNVPLRLRFAPTWRHFDRPSPQVARLLRQAEEAISRDAPADQQEAILGEALRLQPKQFAAHWLLARLQLRGGRAAEAGRHFALAREHDLHPEAAKPSYNRALAEVCAEEGVPLIDIDRLFAESGQADDTLFLDHCHPSAAGDRIIGTALAHALSGLIP
jgi:lysophospholipase L1-like esterase